METERTTARQADQLVHIAAELVGTVRDYGPDETARVLAKTPDGQLGALAVVFAAMVDPDATPAELLAWLDRPVQSRPFTPQIAWTPLIPLGDAEAVKGRIVIDHRRAEVARLSAAGMGLAEIAALLGINRRSVSRHRAALARSDAA